MAIRKALTYKREKDKVEITGEPEDTKGLMWFDLVSSRMIRIVLVVVLLYIAPKASFVPILWQWVKKQIPFMILLIVSAAWLQKLFSG